MQSFQLVILRFATSLFTSSSHLFLGLPSDLIYRYSISNLVSSCRAADFLSSRLQHKFDPGLASCEINSQFQRTDCTTLTQSFFGVIFFFVISGPEFSLNGSGRLRFVAPQTTLRAPHTGTRLHMIDRIYKQLCTSGMPSGGSNEHVTRRKF